MKVFGALLPILLAGCGARDPQAALPGIWKPVVLTAVKTQVADKGQTRGKTRLAQLDASTARAAQMVLTLNADKTFAASLSSGQGTGRWTFAPATKLVSLTFVRIGAVDLTGQPDATMTLKLSDDLTQLSLQSFPGSPSGQVAGKIIYKKS